MLVMKILMSIVVAGSLWIGASAQAQMFEKQAVAMVKRTSVSALEEQMPRRPFADWFKEIVGAQAGIVWQLSECEQGISEPGADMPACVEANAMLPDGRKVVVMVAVGTFRKGITGDPGFYYAVIEHRDQLYSLRRLRDLPEGLRSPESLKEKAEVKLVFPEAQPADRSPGPAAGVPIAAAGRPVANEAITLPPGPDVRRESRRVSEGVLIGNAIKKVSPAFPDSARRVNARGEVQVLVVISENGSVEEARAVSGHLLLRKAAVEAARQWVFSPTKLNGAPVQVQGILTFVFNRQ
jgi:TonB family protein